MGVKIFGFFNLSILFGFLVSWLIDKIILKNVDFIHDVNYIILPGLFLAIIVVNFIDDKTLEKWNL